MHITPWQIVQASVATKRCHSADPQVNKFEKVSSVHHQRSVPGGELGGER